MRLPFGVALVLPGHERPHGRRVVAPQRDLLLGKAAHRTQVGRRVPPVRPDRPALGVARVEDLAAVAADEVVDGVPRQPDGGGVGGEDPPIGVEPQDGVGEEVGELGCRHRAVTANRRCRAASKHSTAAAMPTLSDSVRPAIGIVTRSSTRSSISAGEPVGLVAEDEGDRAREVDLAVVASAVHGRGESSHAPARHRSQHFHGVTSRHDRDVEQRTGRGPHGLGVVHVDRTFAAQYAVGSGRFGGTQDRARIARIADVDGDDGRGRRRADRSSGRSTNGTTAMTGCGVTVPATRSRTPGASSKMRAPASKARDRDVVRCAGAPGTRTRWARRRRAPRTAPWLPRPRTPARPRGRSGGSGAAGAAAPSGGAAPRVEASGWLRGSPAPRATSTRRAKAVGSLTARSARTLRSTSTSASFSPLMSRL